jgi:hypothetical protein
MDGVTLRTTDRDFSRFQVDHPILASGGAGRTPRRLLSCSPRSAGGEGEQKQGDADEDEN